MMNDNVTSKLGQVWMRKLGGKFNLYVVIGESVKHVTYSDGGDGEIV